MADPQNGSKWMVYNWKSYQNKWIKGTTILRKLLYTHRQSKIEPAMSRGLEDEFPLNYLLRVIFTLTHYSDIVSDMPSESIYQIQYSIYIYVYTVFWHSIWYSLWHLFWRTFWHIFWHSFWHSIWHLFCHSFWHLFWHSIWHGRCPPQTSHLQAICSMAFGPICTLLFTTWKHGLSIVRCFSIWEPQPRHWTLSSCIFLTYQSKSSRI